MSENAIEYREDDYKALHLVYVQLMSRVTTADFLEKDYVCGKALDSIFTAFTSIRQAMLDHMCIRATDMIVDIMNIIRPFIGKWNEKREQIDQPSEVSQRIEFAHELRKMRSDLKEKCAEIKEILLAQPRCMKIKEILPTQGT